MPERYPRIPEAGDRPPGDRPPGDPPPTESAAARALRELKASSARDLEERGVEAPERPVVLKPAFETDEAGRVVVRDPRATRPTQVQASRDGAPDPRRLTGLDRILRTAGYPMGGELPYTTGGEQIDIAKMEQGFKAHKLAELTRRRTGSEDWWAFKEKDPEGYAAVVQEAERHAKRKVSDAMQIGTWRVFYDPNPTVLTRELAKLPERARSAVGGGILGEAAAHAAIMPMAGLAAMMPRPGVTGTVSPDLEIQTPIGGIINLAPTTWAGAVTAATRDYEPKNAEEGRQIQEVAGRLAVSGVPHPITAGFLADAPQGFREQVVANVRDGRLLASVWGEDLYEGALRMGWSERSARGMKALGWAVGFGPELLSPDAATAALSIGVMGIKAASGAAKVGRVASRSADALERAAELAERPEVIGGGLDLALRSLDEVPGQLRRLATQRLGVELGVNENVPGHLRQLLKQEEEARGKAEKAVQKLAAIDAELKRVEGAERLKAERDVQLTSKEALEQRALLLRTMNGPWVLDQLLRRDVIARALDDAATRASAVVDQNQAAFAELSEVARRVQQAQKRMDETTGEWQAARARYAEVKADAEQTLTKARSALARREAGERLMTIRSKQSPVQQEIARTRSARVTAEQELLAAVTRSREVNARYADLVKAYAKEANKALKAAGDLRELDLAVKTSSGFDVTIGGLRAARDVNAQVDAIRQQAKEAERLFVQANAQYQKATGAVVNRARSEKAIKERFLAAKARELKYDDLADSLKGRGEGAGKVLRKMADDVRRGEQAARSLPLRGGRLGFQDVLGPATVGPVATRGGGGERTVNPKAFQQHMIGRYGQAAVDYVQTRRPMPDAAQRAFDRLWSADTPIVVTADEVADLQDIPRYMEQAEQAVHPDADALVLIEAIELARLDPDHSVQGIKNKLAKSVKLLVDDLDPIKARVGRTSKGVAEVMASIDYISGRLTEELMELVRYNRGDDSRLIAQLRQYVGTTDPVELSLFQRGSGPGDKTVVNRGPESLWSAFRRQVGTDERAAPTSQRLKVWMAQHAKWTADLQAASKKDPAAAGAQPVPPDLPEMDDHARWARGAVLAWLPGGQSSANVAPDDGARLYAIGLGLIKTSNTPEEFVDQMRAATSNVIGAVETDQRRAMVMFAQNVGVGAIANRANDLLVRAIGGRVTAAEAEDVNRLIVGQYDKVADQDAALAVLNRLGMPVTQRTVRPNDTTRLTVQLIKAGEDQAGTPHYMLSTMATELEKAIGNAVKELDAQYAHVRDGRTNLLVGALGDWHSLWKTSVTTGLISPNPRFWVNNVVGDLSQMWFEHGLGTAARMSANNIWTNVPWFGPRMQVLMSDMSRQYAGRPVFGDVFSALFNPHIAGVVAGRNGVMVTRSGMVLPYDRLAVQVAEDGILDTFVHEELLEGLSRATPAWWSQFARGFLDWNANMTSWATVVQQRQRVGLYLEMLRQGASRSEAKLAVRNALYDWRHPVNDGMLRSVTRAIPFGRFWALALTQMGRRFAEVWTEPGRALIDAAMGRSALARLRQQVVGMEVLPNLIAPAGGPEEVEAGEREAKAWDVAAKWFRPGFARGRPLLEVFRNPWALQSYLLNSRGQMGTHSMMIGPPLTAIDSANLYLSWIVGALGAVNRATGTPIPMAPDWEEQFFEPHLSLLAPWLQEPISALLNKWADTGTYDVGGRMRVSTAEARLMSFGLWNTGTNRDPDGALRANAAAVTVFRMVPFYGVQLPALLGSFPVGERELPDGLRWAVPSALGADNPDVWWRKQVRDRPELAPVYSDPELVSGLSWFFRTWTSIGRYYPFLPQRELEYRQDRRAEELGADTPEPAAPFEGYTR